MGAKLGIYKPLTTSSLIVNTIGSDCKTDGDCTDGTATSTMLKTKVPSSYYADKSKVCCMLYQPTVPGTATPGEIALAAINIGLLGINATVGSYNKYCSYDFPTLIKGFDNKTYYQSHDVKTGLVIANTTYGSS